jgi:hypothetical protein
VVLRGYLDYTYLPYLRLNMEFGLDRVKFQLSLAVSDLVLGVDEARQ